MLRRRIPWPTRARVAALTLTLVASSAPAARAQRATPVVPSAEHTREARALFEQGLAAADGERWGEAVLFFQRSLALVPRPSAHINLGNALVRSGRVVEAEQHLASYLATADARSDAARAAQARTMLAEAQRAVVVLRVRVQVPEGEGAVVLSVDGRARAEQADAQGARTLRLDPGARTLLARRASDGAEGERTVNALPGAQVDVTLELRGPAATGPARLTLVGAPPGAEVWLDGVARGPARERVELEPGTHTLEVRSAGFSSTRQTLRATPGQSIQLLVSLSPVAPRARGVLASPAFWIVTGLVVAGGATAVVAGVAAMQPVALDLRGTTNLVFQLPP